MVDRAVTDHFEILRVARRWRVGVCLIKRVGHAHAFDGSLLDAVDLLGCLDTGDFEDRRHDVDHVMELGANGAEILDVTRP